MAIAGALRQVSYGHSSLTEAQTTRELEGRQRTATSDILHFAVILLCNLRKPGSTARETTDREPTSSSLRSSSALPLDAYENTSSRCKRRAVYALFADDGHELDWQSHLHSGKLVEQIPHNCRESELTAFIHGEQRSVE